MNRHRGLLIAGAIALVLFGSGLSPAVWPGPTGQDRAAAAPASQESLTLSPILAPGGAGSATGLTAQGRCSERDVGDSVVDFRWTPAAQSGSEQRLVVSFFSDGLAEATQNLQYISPALPPDQSTLSVETLSRGLNHTWWIVTRQGGGWAPSAPGTAPVQICLGEDEEQPGSGDPR